MPLERPACFGVAPVRFEGRLEVADAVTDVDGFGAAGARGPDVPGLVVTVRRVVDERHRPAAGGEIHVVGNHVDLDAGARERGVNDGCDAAGYDADRTAARPDRRDEW